MEDLKALASSIVQIAEEKGITQEKIIEVIELALAAAYKKDNDRRGENVKADFDAATGKVKFWQILDVVDDSMIYSEEELEVLKDKEPEEDEEPEEGKKIRFNPKKHIMVEEAIKQDAKIKIGKELLIALKADDDYGRIAAQTAKQVVLQRLKEAEREAIMDDYQQKEGEVLTGVVQRQEGQNVFFELGKTIGILPFAEQIPGEIYKIGQRHRLLLKSVEMSSKGPIIVLSRAYPKLVSRLFEIEVPEVSSGQVEIKSIAREPGFRTKIAVTSNEEGIDPIGAMVGQRGTRVMAVINSLAGEKIDIILYSDDPSEFIANALSPAKITDVEVEEKGQAVVIVPEDQLSLAIGKGGQNVRLAAKLTGWKIDVKLEGAKEPIKQEEVKEEKKEEEKEEKPKKKKTIKKEKK